MKVERNNYVSKIIKSQHFETLNYELLNIHHQFQIKLSSGQIVEASVLITVNI